MASGPAKPGQEVSDWEDVQPSDWQDVSASGGAPPSEENPIQQGFDKLTAIEPHGTRHTGIKPVDEGLTALSNIGAGGIGMLSPIMHPENTLEAIGHPKDTAKSIWQSAEAHPLETIEQGIGGAAAGAGAGLLGGEALDAIPSTARAGRTLDTIRNEAANVRVPTTRMGPEVSRFQELTQRGGSTAKPITQLIPRIRDNMVPNVGTKPLTFPEARDFYSNVSSQSAEDLSRLNPTMRRQMGSVRAGMHGDLTEAADSIGRGQDYANAVREYAQASRLKDILAKSGKAAARYAPYGAAAAAGYGGYKSLKGLVQ